MLQELLQIQQKNPKRVIGLMSGTSADGIDACLAEISGNGLDTKIKIVDFKTYPYDESTRTAILEACNPETGNVDKVCRLNFYLGKLFADAARCVANKAHIPLSDIDLIGSHGQTICHLPLYGSTLQIGEPSVIAQETGVTTVADFRPADMAAGGQGAPLVPYVDFILFRDREKGRALQNIGGIANVTYLPPDGNINDVIAFDTGPGNMIIDRVTELITHDEYHFDKDGKLAARGRVHEGILANLLAHPYFKKSPPKTAGREEFGRYFADQLFKDAVYACIKDVDVMATVTAFTARTIADSYKQWILPHNRLSEVILSGGGCYNSTLVNFLIHYLSPSIKICTIDTFGIASSAKEALAFAILANETISGNPNNIPHATGANEAVVLGKIVPGKKRKNPTEVCRRFQVKEFV
ncbi:MAG TPA: anhydro-N-acetylmuramic acid kinase [Candidatus Brocadiaceae bacterium]